MKLCFPVQANNQMESLVYNHFGSAPNFVIVDTETGSVITVDNRDLHHTHGACNPVMALNGEQVDAVIVGGIGGGAVNKLNQKGVKVFMAVKPTISENIDLFKAGALQQLGPQHTCSGHSHGHSCNN
jgi:predicted Fe-Mo cluster-binding NifX family protein